MRTTSLIRHVVPGMLALLFVSGCAGIQQTIGYPHARVENAELKGISLTSATLEFTLGVDNPYAVALPLVGLDFDLSTRGKSFLTGSADLDGSIPANGTGRVKVPVDVPFMDIYSIAKDVQLGTAIPYHADLGLRVTAPVAGAISVPLDADGEIELPGSR